STSTPPCDRVSSWWTILGPSSRRSVRGGPTSAWCTAATSCAPTAAGCCSGFAAVRPPSFIRPPGCGGDGCPRRPRPSCSFSPRPLRPAAYAGAASSRSVTFPSKADPPRREIASALSKGGRKFVGRAAGVRLYSSVYNVSYADRAEGGLKESLHVSALRIHPH